jgi:hypothetical protein
MSDAITSSPVPQSQTTSTPEQPPAVPEVPPAVPADAAQTAEQAAAEQAAAQAAEEAARKQAAETLRACVSAYRKGERSYRDGLLRAGELADSYITQRLMLGDKRSAATQALEGQLAVYASTPVDANELVGVWQAYRLLAGEEKSDTPYGHWRDAYRQLVRRLDKDTPSEHWVLLPGLEQECQEVYAKACKDGLSKAAVVELCRGVQRKAAAAEKAAAEKAAALEAAKLAAAEQERAKAVEANRRKAAELEAAEKAAQQAESDAERAALTAKAEQARREKEEAAKAAIAAHAAATEQEAAKARAEKAALEAKRAAEKAAAKAEKAAEQATAKNKPTQATTPPAERGTVSQNLLAVAKHGVAKDVAGMAAELVTGGDEPDDVSEALLVALKGSKELSNVSRRAIDAALLVIRNAASRTAKPADVPAAIAERNGQLVGAA